ncbi:MAG: hypothetical protein QOE15_511 [Acidimicrobiaceae bacterium]|nr:hypothetical protein [Acidimicrobiaceae bacterium]
MSPVGPQLVVLAAASQIAVPDRGWSGKSVFPPKPTPAKAAAMVTTTE